MNTFSVINKSVCISALLASLTLFTGTSQADSPQPAGGPPDKAELRDRAERQEHAADKLNLSPEQRQAYQNAMKGMYESMRDGREFHDELRQLTHSDQYDEKKVRALIRKRHQEAEENIVKSSKAMHEFYKSLSPEQKERFDTLRDNMKEQRRDHLKDRLKEHRGKTPAADKDQNEDQEKNQQE